MSTSKAIKRQWRLLERVSDKLWSCWHLVMNFKTPPKSKRIIFVVLNNSVCNTLLWQPQETNTSCLSFLLILSPIVTEYLFNIYSTQVFLFLHFPSQVPSTDYFALENLKIKMRQHSMGYFASSFLCRSTEDVTSIVIFDKEWYI